MMAMILRKCNHSGDIIYLMEKPRSIADVQALHQVAVVLIKDAPHRPHEAQGVRAKVHGTELAHIHDRDVLCDHFPLLPTEMRHEEAPTGFHGLDVVRDLFFSPND